MAEGPVTRAFSVLLAACLIVAAPGFAQTQTVDDAEYRRAFEETMRKPGDPATLMRYAELSVKVGNIEGAISALERLLLIDGDQPKVKLELGVLYFRLGSYEASRSYLESARASGKADADTKSRADQFLADIDEKSSKSQFSGQLLTGLRYSTNANSGPGGGVSSFGDTAVPTPNVSGRPDFSVVAAAALQHRYDLGRQDGGMLETDVALFGARQFQIVEANVAFIDIITGPRTLPFDGWAESVSLKPLLMARYIAVQDQTSYWAWGAGLEAAAPLGPGGGVALTMFGRRREYPDNFLVPTNSNSTGNELVSTMEVRGNIGSAFTLSLAVNFTRYIAAVPSESYGQFGVGAILAWRFTDPLGLNGRTWLATFNAGVDHADYDQPDPVVDPDVRRQQFDYNLGVMLAVPLDEKLSFLVQGSYAKRDASVPNYAYQAFTALAGISWRF